MLHRRYHDCFLATKRTRKPSLVELGRLSVIRVFIRLGRFAVFELIPSKPKTTVLSLLFRYGLIQFAGEFEAPGGFCSLASSRAISFQFLGVAFSHIWTIPVDNSNRPEMLSSGAKESCSKLNSEHYYRRFIVGIPLRLAEYSTS